jgi:phage shock protein A
MSLFHRISTNFKADAHGVVDALEDRPLLLRQYVRDAEAELGRKRGRLQQVEAELQSLLREEKSTASELERFEADAEVALGASNDELARFALKGVLLRRARQRRHQARREQLELELSELGRLIADQAERYESLKERVNAELAASGTSFDSAFENVSEEQVELELLRRRAKPEVSK